MLILGCLLVALAAWVGMVSVRHGRRGSATLILMIAAFGCQLYVLGLWGQRHGHCPLGNVGEVALFIAWSQTLFYILVGPTFRTSLLGLFSTPVIFLGMVLALIFGSPAPSVNEGVDYWREVHLGFSVMAYGAFALSAVAGVMVLVLRRKLKRGESDGLVETMSSVRNLDTSLLRLLILGLAVFTAGIVGGLMMEGGGAGAHLAVALVIWTLYLAVVVKKCWKGMPPKSLAWSAISLFFAAFLIFAVL